MAHAQRGDRAHSGTRLRGCPVLVLHGGADPLVDRAQAQIFAGASARGRLEWWPDGEHTIYNHAGERDALVGDWLADVLTETASLHYESFRIRDPDAPGQEIPRR